MNRGEKLKPIRDNQTIRRTKACPIAFIYYALKEYEIKFTANFRYKNGERISSEKRVFTLPKDVLWSGRPIFRGALIIMWVILIPYVESDLKSFRVNHSLIDTRF